MHQFCWFRGHALCITQWACSKCCYNSELLLPIVLRCVSNYSLPNSHIIFVCIHACIFFIIKLLWGSYVIFFSLLVMYMHLENLANDFSRWLSWSEIDFMTILDFFFMYCNTSFNCWKDPAHLLLQTSMHLLLLLLTQKIRMSIFFKYFVLWNFTWRIWSKLSTEIITALKYLGFVSVGETMFWDWRLQAVPLVLHKNLQAMKWKMWPKLMAARTCLLKWSKDFLVSRSRNICES